MSNTKIILNRQSDLILDNAIITNPSGLTKGDILELVGDLTALGLADEAEAIARANGDSALQTALTAAETALNAAIASGDATVTSALNAYITLNDAALSTEVGLRVAADSSLQSAIDAEKTRAEAAESGLATDIEAIENEHAADVLTLQANIDNEQSRAEAAEGVLRVDLAKEVSDRIDDVDAEETRATTEENAIKASLTTETAARVSADSTLTTNLAAEVTRATDAEEVLDGKITTEKGRIDAILFASDADKDSFAEIVALINSVDTENDEAFAAYVLSNNLALSAETASRIAGDSTLTEDLAAEVSRATDAESDLATDISAEETRATTAEGVLRTDLAAEATRAKAAEGAIATDLATEITNRTAADTAFTNSLNNEIADRIAGDQTVQTNLDGEVDRATAAEGVLRTDLATEVTDRISAVSAEEAARISGDSTLTTNLASEVTRATAAEGVLTSDLADEVSRAIAAEGVIAAGLAGFSGATISRLNVVEGDGEGSIAKALSDAKAHADQAELDAIAEAELKDVARAATTATNLSNAISTEVSDRNAAILIEKSRAEAAELVLTNDLADEVEARIGGDSTLQSNINIEKGRIDAILDGSDVNLDQFKEIVSFVNAIDLENDNELLAAVTNINIAISGETAARVLADGVLQSNLDAYEVSNDLALATEVTARELGDSDLQSNLDTVESNLQSNLDQAVTGLTAAIDSEIEARELADSELDGKIADILSNTDVTAIDSFTEVVAEIDTRILTTRKDLSQFTVDNRPRMIGFNESPELLDSGEFDEDNNAIMKLRDTFTSSVLGGTQIVFLNGLMQLEKEDYERVVPEFPSANAGISIRFIEAPIVKSRVNIYGVNAGAGLIVLRGDIEAKVRRLSEAGPIVGVNKVDADLTDEQPLEGDFQVFENVEGELTDKKPLEGELTDELPLATTFQVFENVEGELTDKKPLEGELTDELPLEGELTDEQPLEGDLTDEQPLEGI